jgi:hypothetical protein
MRINWYACTKTLGKRCPSNIATCYYTF